MSQSIKKVINFLAVIGILGLLYFGFKYATAIKKQKMIQKVYEKCKYLRKGMSIAEVYLALGNDILPQPIIKRFDDSAYHHYLQYPPMLAKKPYLLIEVDPSESIVIDILGCDP